MRSRLDRRDAMDVMVALGYLPEREREVLIDRRILGHSSRQIAERLGVSHGRVAQLETQAIRRFDQLPWLAEAA